MPVRPLALGACCAAALGAATGELSGSVAAEERVYATTGAFPGQDYRSSASGAVDLAWRDSWDAGRRQVRIAPFGRIDQRDSQRTHADLREAAVLAAGDGWEGWLGVRQVFWGVTESRHLVNIVNQTDLIEDVREEVFLGQPMASLALLGEDMGMELHVLAGFRERTFPGPSGRLRTAVPVDVDRPVYDADGLARQAAVALRAYRRWEILDVGISAFDGIARDPRLVPELSDGQVRLRPYYDRIDQIGLDAQLTGEAVLVKAEATWRCGQGDAYTATVVGCEIPWPQVADSDCALTAFLEYDWDERGRAATTPYQDDLFAAVRLDLNDAADTRCTVGVYRDNRSQAVIWLIEAERRLGTRTTLAIRGLAFVQANAADAQLSGYFQDDHVQATLSWHF